MLIGDYMSIPLKRDIPNWTVIDDVKTKYHDIVTFKKGFWAISIGDHKISNIENYLIVLFMGFGFLRVIDMLIYIERYNKH